MKIPLPAGFFIYRGKGSKDQNQTPFITKSADIIRDYIGQVVGSTNSYSLKITFGNVFRIFLGAEP